MALTDAVVLHNFGRLVYLGCYGWDVSLDITYNGQVSHTAFSYDPATKYLTITPSLASHGDNINIVVTPIMDDYIGAQHNSGKYKYIFGIGFPELPVPPKAFPAYKVHPSLFFNIPLQKAIDPDGDQAYYECNPNARPFPTWLTCNYPGTEFSFSGTPDDPPGTSYLNILYVWDDSTADQRNYYRFAFDVEEDGFPSIDTTGQTVDALTPFTFTLPAVVDPQDGDPVIMHIRSWPSWLNYNNATNVFSGTSTSTYGTEYIDVYLSDSYNEKVEQIPITIVNPLTLAILRPQLNQDIEFPLFWEFAYGQTQWTTVPLNLIISPKGEKISYSLNNDGGSLLDFMAFNSLTRNFEITPPKINRYDLKLRGTDEVGLLLDLPVTIEIQRKIVFSLLFRLLVHMR